LRTLVDYTIRRHYAELAGAPHPPLALLEAVIERQAALIARWMLVGFVHGVMNTDNMAISGETIDYGPCAFLDAYDPTKTFSSIDAHGRYAYGNQPAIAQWNLTRLAETLLPLFEAEEKRAVAMATEALGNFSPRFQHHWRAGMRRKLGLFTEEPEDLALIEALLAWMQTTNADYTNTFADLAPHLSTAASPRSDDELVGWHARWQARLARQPQPLAESDRIAPHARSGVHPAQPPRGGRARRRGARRFERDGTAAERARRALRSPATRPRVPLSGPGRRRRLPDILWDVRGVERGANYSSRTGWTVDIDRRALSRHAACGHASGSFAEPQDDKRGIVRCHNHAAGLSVGWCVQKEPSRGIEFSPSLVSE